MQDLQELISELGACVLAVSMHAHTYTPRRGGGEAGRAWGGGGGGKKVTLSFSFSWNVAPQRSHSLQCF